MINHLSYALSGTHEVTDYLKLVDRRIVKDDLKSFDGAVEGFESIIHPHLWDAIYASSLSMATKDPQFNGGKDWNTYGLLLCETDSFHFSVRSPKREEVGRHVLVDGGDDVELIASVLPAPSVLFAMAERPVLFDAFELPSGCDLDAFDGNVLVAPTGRRAFLPWTRIDIDAPRETLIMCPSSSRSCCVVELGMKPACFQRWEFNRVTGKPVGAVLLNRESAIIMAMLGEIRRSSYMPGLGAVLDLVGHPDFNVRWECAKCAFSLHRDSGFELLKVLSEDGHPFVRNQALQLLAMFGEDARHAE